MPGLTLDLDLSISRAEFRDSDPAGDEIPGSVESVLAAGVSYRHASGWFGGLRLRYFGPRPALAASGNERRAGRRGGGRDRVDSRGVPIPTYPAESRRLGEEGLVVLEVQVRADGTVGEVRVTSDPGYPRLTEAAIDAARRTEFTPATRDGRSVEGTVTIPFRFVLRER